MPENLNPWYPYPRIRRLVLISVNPAKQTASEFLSISDCFSIFILLEMAISISNGKAEPTKERSISLASKTLKL